MAEILRRICHITGVSWIFNIFNYTFLKAQYFDIRNLLVYNNIVQEYDVDTPRYTGFNDIPEECILLIFKKLEIHHLIKASRVCKLWKEIIDGSPVLWGSAELSLTKPPARTYLSYVYENELDKTRRYVDCLISRKARLRYLAIHMHYFNNEHLKTLNNLFDRGCCECLSDVKLEWYETRFSGDKAHIFTSSFAFFLSTLALLSEHCEKSLRSLSCQLNFTDQSIPYITSFQNLSTLVIRCTPRVQHISHKHMSTLLANLNRLQVLELTVTIEPHNIRPFFIRSHSLRVLNLSNCVNFLIAVMDTPLLERYIARGVMCHRNCVPAHSRFCMFDVLKRGAQQLDKINDVMVREKYNRIRRYSCNEYDSDSYDDFTISAAEEARLRICFCPRHNKREVTLRDSNAAYSRFI